MRFFVIFLVVFFPLAAFAQTQLGDEPGGIVSMIWAVVQMIAPVVLGSSLVSSFVSSKGGPVKTWVMRVVDFLAVNWLKARNDPAAQ